MPTIYLKSNEELEQRSRIISLGEIKKERGTTDQSPSDLIISESSESITSNMPFTEGEIMAVKKNTTA